MERKFHSRHEYIAKTGKRISKGGWERLNRAYAVYEWDKLHIIERRPGGKIKVRRCQTLVLLPETAKHNHKVSRADRWHPDSKRARFPEGKHAGICK